MSQISDLSGNWLGLDGRVCVVSGAGSGIGAAIAKGLGQVGAKVALLDRNITAASEVAKEIQAMGGQALAVECDISSEEAVKRAADTVRNKLGLCYGLINNAGLLKPGNHSTDIECTGCLEQCLMSVHVQGDRLFVMCGDPDFGRVTIPIERLRQWHPC